MSWRATQVHSQLLKQTPEEFEKFIASLWEQQGWKTTLTRGSNDAGIDVIAKRSGIHGEKAAIQAKRYAPSNKVSRPDIQQYDTLRRQEPDIDFVIIATTSDFTNQAEELAEQLNVKLVTGIELADAVVDVFSMEEISEFFGEAPSDSQEEATNQAETYGTESESQARANHDDQWRRSDPENFTISQLADSLFGNLSEDDLSEKEKQLAGLYEYHWEQRNEEFNGTAGSSLVFNFDQAEYVEVYQVLVGLHSIEFADRKHGKEAYETAKKYGWEIEEWEPNTSANYLGKNQEDKTTNALLNLKPNGEIGETLDAEFEARFSRLVIEGFLNTTLDKVRSIDQHAFDRQTENRTHYLSDYQ